MTTIKSDASSFFIDLNLVLSRSDGATPLGDEDLFRKVEQAIDLERLVTPNVTIRDHSADGNAMPLFRALIGEQNLENFLKFLEEKLWQCSVDAFPPIADEKGNLMISGTRPNSDGSYFILTVTHTNESPSPWITLKHTWIPPEGKHEYLLDRRFDTLQDAGREIKRVGEKYLDQA